MTRNQWGIQMTISLDRMVFAFAGTVVLVSLALSQLHDVRWLWLTAFVGANMVQASFTGFCPAAMVFKSLGAKAGVIFS
jgi:hypothetical protein